MGTKELLLRIPELRLAGNLALTSDAQLDVYVKTLNAFIDDFPAISDKMQDACDNSAWSMLSQHVIVTCNLLERIHASDLSARSRQQFEMLIKPQQKDESAIEAFIENFTLSVSSLSIDVQMALKGVAASPRPRPAARPAARPKPAASSAPKSGGYARPLVLAVDNAVMFLGMVKRMLENQPYDVHCVGSGEEALEFVKTRRPDAFLLDIEMPGIDGYELARRLKGSGHTAPVIFVTANSSRDCVDKAAEAGAVGMLMKPLRENQLLAKLNEHMR
jgi:CheY-like chemotaxis protein